jgi:O-Antigen ligase
MEENQLLSMMLYSGGALAAWLAAIFALGAFIGLQRHYRDRMMMLVLPVILVTFGAGALLSGRNITSAEFEIATASGVDTVASTWLMRLATMLVLGICAARLISISQKYEYRSRGGFPLLVAFLLFYVTNVVLNNIFGTRPTFDQRTIYPLVVFIAVYFSRNKDQGTMIDGGKIGLLLFLAGSCIAAAMVPAIAVQSNYAGVIPKLNIRLWGLGSNPNSIGPLAVVFLLLLVHKPFRNPLLQYGSMLLGAAVLVLAQSKTAWAAAVLALAVLWWGRIRYKPVTTYHAGYPMRSFAGPIAVSVGGLMLVMVAAFMIVFTDHFMTLANDQQVTTLTGRTAIWQVAIDTWKDNPLFGYGATMWDTEFRRAIGMDFAYNAHNQFLQTLSVAGAVGMVGLVVYTLLLLRYSLAANRATRGLAMALFSLLFIRYFTEAPLNMSSIITGEFVTHLLLFSLILDKGKQRQPAVATQPGYPMQQQMQW